MTQSKFVGVQVAAQFKYAEIRATVRGCQHLPGLFIRMFDKSSNWSAAGGLQSLIPTLLQSCVAGYPFVLPDMVC